MDRNKLLKGVFRTTIVSLVFALVFSLFVLYVIPFSLAIFWGNDIEVVDDSRFAFSSELVEKDKNMFYELDRIEQGSIFEGEGLDLSKNFLNYDNFSEEDLLELFSKNQEALSIFSIAANLEIYQNPYLLDSENFDLLTPAVTSNSSRALSRISLLRSLWLADEGYEAESIAEALNSLSVGSAMMKREVTTIEYLVGMAMYRNAMQALQKIIPKIGDEKLLADTFEKLKLRNIEVNDSYLKTEYHFAKKALEHVVSGELGLYESYVNRRVINNKFYYKKNLTYSYYVDGFNRLMDNLALTCSEKEIIPHEKNFDFDSLTDFPRLYFTENVMGKILSIPANAALTNVESKRCSLMHDKIMTEIELAKRIYELENKIAPEAMDELVPDYFEALPIDPLTGEAKDFILYLFVF